MGKIVRTPNDIGVNVSNSALFSNANISVIDRSLIDSDGNAAPGAVQFSAYVPTEWLYNNCNPNEIYDPLQHTAVCPPRFVYNKEAQRGVMMRNHVEVPVSDAKHLDQMVKDILAGQADVLSLVCNLPENNYVYVETTRQLYILDGPITRPDSHHRVAAIVEAEKIFRLNSDAIPDYNPDSSYNTIFHTKSFDGEGELFDRYNKGKPVAPQTLAACKIRSGHGDSALKLVGKLLRVCHDLDAVTAKTALNSSYSFNLNTLVGAIREAKFSDTPQHLDFLVRFVALWKEQLPCVFREERSKDKNLTKKDTVSMLAPVIGGKFMLAKYLLENHPATWENLLRQTWNEPFFAKTHPLWQEIGMISFKDGKIATSGVYAMKFRVFEALKAEVLASASVLHFKQAG